MKKIFIIHLFLFCCQSIFGQDLIFFDGETCKCPGASTGYSATISGTKYTVVDDTSIASEITSENYNLCTTNVTNMYGLFEYKNSFNSNIGFWDTSNVV